MARPSVPSDIKRRLRAEAGFGCCACGYPFIEYHHIIPFAEEQHFRPDDMMALCSRCHDLCTSGALPEGEQRKIKRSPKNIVEKELRGLLYVNSSECKVRLGGGEAIDTPDLLNFRGTSLLSVERSEDGRLLISSIVQAPDGTTVARLKKNEWTISPDKLWDFDAKPCFATARSGPREISFQVDARNGEIALRGTWWIAGKAIRFTEREVTVGERSYHATRAVRCGGFLMVG